LGWRTCWQDLRCSTTIPDEINSLESEFEKVTPELIQKTGAGISGRRIGHRAGAANQAR